MAYKSIIRPLLFRFDPERVHGFVARALRFFPVARRARDRRLAISVSGIDFATPLGLAAGFDKDARFFPHIYKFGFGCVEVGTLTPAPQEGNPGKRIFRLPKFTAIINRMGFPNDGLAVALDRIKKRRNSLDVLGVNIGANKNSSDKIADYVLGYREVAPFCDYVTVNVSSPNTAGLRQLETGSLLEALLAALQEEMRQHKTPIFLKVSPDLSEDQIASTCESAERFKIAGLIVGNTTIQRPGGTDIGEGGGLSGSPLSSISERALGLFSARLKGSIPLISVGGIASAEDAYRRIKIGASLVQIYSSFIYEGESLARRINEGLVVLLREDGFETIEQAVGSGVNRATIAFRDSASETLKFTEHAPVLAI